MAISRMQEPQQIQSGIGSLQDPRQGYFLGKLVKKAGRAVKKIVKSPIGKAAMIGALGFGIPGTGIGGLFGRAGFGGAATGLFGQQGIGATLSAAKAGLAKRFAPAAVMNAREAAIMRNAGGAGKASFLSRLNPFGKNFDEMFIKNRVK